MTELKNGATIEIDMVDLAAILTETFCGSYTPFKNLFVENVRKVEGDEFTFELSLSTIETEAA